MNRYLRDHMIGRDRKYNDYRMRDGRNNYSSRGGYSRDLRRGDYARGYGRDRERIGENYNHREYDDKIKRYKQVAKETSDEIKN